MTGMSKDAGDYASPTVTVVMAVHDGAIPDYLDRAIASVREQRLNDFELVIVLDGPVNARLRDVINMHQAADERIVLVQCERNGGPAVARNTGMAIAKGRYLAVMDADDVALTERLRSQAEFLDQNPQISVVGSACYIIDGRGRRVGTRHLPLDPDALARYALVFCPLNNPTVMAKTDVIRHFGYEPGFRCGEDHRLWLRLLKAGFRIANIDEPLLEYRVDESLYDRRRGYEKARTDLLNRLYATQLAPLWKRPLVAASAFGFFVFRFMPKRFIAAITRVFERTSMKRASNRQTAGEGRK